MVSKTLKLTTVLCTAVLFVMTYEIAAWMRQHIDSWAVLGLALLVQIAAIVLIIIKFEGGLNAIGFTPGSWLAGLKKGALWSIGFAIVAGTGMAVLYSIGQNPIAMLRFGLPSRSAELVLFFTVGGLIAPIAEELCFRGVLYTYFRRWGIMVALVASTAIFVALHLPRGIPVPQIVGGIVFAIAYETSNNLMVPITIHTLGNLAIFSLSLL